jgi:hypothetical protein
MMQAIVLPSDLPTASFVIQRRAFKSCFRRGLTPKVHESGIHSHAVKPGGESGFAPKRRKLSKCLNEGLLSEVVRVRGIVRHSKTDRVYTAAV